MGCIICDMAECFLPGVMNTVARSIRDPITELDIYISPATVRTDGLSLVALCQISVSMAIIVGVICGIGGIGGILSPSGVYSLDTLLEIF